MFQCSPSASQTQNCYQFSHTLSKCDGQNEGQVMWEKDRNISSIINPNQILVPEWNWLVEKFGKFGRRGNTIRDTYVTLDGKSCMFS